MKFDRAKVVLRDHAFKLGSEMFTRAALKLLTKTQAEMGIEEAKKELDIYEFAEKIFNTQKYSDETIGEFWETLFAINALAEKEKEDRA